MTYFETELLKVLTDIRDSLATIEDNIDALATDKMGVATGAETHGGLHLMRSIANSLEILSGTKSE